MGGTQSDEVRSEDATYAHRENQSMCHSELEGKQNKKPKKSNTWYEHSLLLHLSVPPLCKGDFLPLL